jgi:hypothetical protein
MDRLKVPDSLSRPVIQRHEALRKEVVTRTMAPRNSRAPPC